MNAIVTGASKGIGRAIVEQLAANNYNVAFCARNKADLDSFSNELQHKYPNLTFYGFRADMENMDEVKEFAEFSLEKLKQIDVLVNNAGLFIPKGIFEEDEHDLQRQMNVNVYSSHFLSKFFAQSMKERSAGHIINICSIASLKPVLHAASYSITKAALLSQTRAFREALMPFGVKVSAILPGATLTESWSGTTLPPERFVAAQDIAAAVISCLNMSFGANLDEIIIRPQKGEI